MGVDRYFEEEDRRREERIQKRINDAVESLRDIIIKTMIKYEYDLSDGYGYYYQSMLSDKENEELSDLSKEEQDFIVLGKIADEIIRNIIDRRE